MLNYQEVTRRKRPMRAVQVGIDNAQEIADWCRGEVVNSTVRIMGAQTSLPAVKLNRPSTGGRDYTTALVTMWVVEYPNEFKIFKDEQYQQLFENVSPTKPKWVEGLSVRVIRKENTFAGWVGIVAKILPGTLNVRFPNGQECGFGSNDLEVTNEVPVRTRPVIGTLDNPIMLVPGDAVSHNLGYDLMLPSGVITQLGFSGEGAPLPVQPAKVWETGDIRLHTTQKETISGVPAFLTDGVLRQKAVDEYQKIRTLEEARLHNVGPVPKDDQSAWIISDEEAARIAEKSFGPKEGKHAMEDVTDPFHEPPNPTPAGESLEFEEGDKVQVTAQGEWYQWDGIVKFVDPDRDNVVGVMFMDDVREYREFAPTELKHK